MAIPIKRGIQAPPIAQPVSSDAIDDTPLEDLHRVLELASIIYNQQCMIDQLRAAQRPGGGGPHHDAGTSTLEVAFPRVPSQA